MSEYIFDWIIKTGKLKEPSSKICTCVWCVFTKLEVTVIFVSSLYTPVWKYKCAAVHLFNLTKCYSVDKTRMVPNAIVN